MNEQTVFCNVGFVVQCHVIVTKCLSLYCGVHILLPEGPKGQQICYYIKLTVQTEKHREVHIFCWCTVCLNEAGVRPLPRQESLTHCLFH